MAKDKDTNTSDYGFKTPSDARDGVLKLKKAKGDNSYKKRVILGLLNRAKSTIEKTDDSSKVKDIEQAIVIWTKYLDVLRGQDEEEDEEFDDEATPDNTLNDAGAFDMELGDKNIIHTKGKGRGLVIKLTEQGGYSIYYWKDDPAMRYPTEVYLDSKKVYMPIRMVHMGFEPDNIDPNDDVGRLQTESEKNKDDKDLKGHQPKKYFDGLKKDTKKDRVSQFKNQANKKSSDPSAYKLAPGDSRPTKPSEYTKDYKRKFKDKLKDKLKENLTEDSSKGLENKAKESGAPLSILKKVYDRGLAAWRTGHRPGASQHAWAMARVNSFLTGGKTTTTADKDLHQKWKGKSEQQRIQEMFTFWKDTI
jgi:hypothetical protein